MNCLQNLKAVAFAYYKYSDSLVGRDRKIIFGFLRKDTYQQHLDIWTEMHFILTLTYKTKVSQKCVLTLEYRNVYYPTILPESQKSY